MAIFKIFFLLPAAIAAQKVAAGPVMTADDVYYAYNIAAVVRAHTCHDNDVMLVVHINYDKT